MRQLRPPTLAIGAWTGKCCPVRRKLLLAIVVCAATVPSSSALAASITLTPESDTYVRSSDPTVAHGLESTFDVHGGASSYGCGTGPAAGLLRFNLAGIPAGATITGATLKLTSKTGFAFDGDPDHHAIFLANDSWSESTVTWNTRPADGVVQQVPPAEWLLNGLPLSTSPDKLGSTSAFEAVGCAGTHVAARNFGSANLRTRIASERVGDGKLSLEVFTIPCGTPFTVVCQNGKLKQSYFLRYFSREGSVLNAPRLVVDYEVPPPLETPSLIRVVSTGGNGAFVIGRVDGASNLALTLAASTAPTCSAGALPGGGSPAGAPVSATTDEDGYFSAALSGVTPGNFVTVRVTAPAATAASACLVSSGDNDFWPKALTLTGGTATARDFIDSAGKARWYKFDVTPGQRIEVALSGLPADYDLAVFKDIGQAFAAQLTPADAADLTKLSAEYAPSVFSPSVFSPSVFSPSVFSPDAYSPSVFSPSVFSPSVFSPSVFSPSVFSPSVFSPSVFSPSVFSPSVFSPSVFSPSVFSPSVFSPSVFSPEEIAQAFSSAQTRSIIGVSATQGTADESAVVNSWNSSGSFYVRVSGHGGAFDTGSQFTVSVTKGATSCAGVTDTTLTPRAPAAVTGVRTLILTDSSKVSLDRTAAGRRHAREQARRVQSQAGDRRRRRRRRRRRPGGRAEAAGRSERRLPVREEPRRRGDQGHRRLLPPCEPRAPVRRHRRRRRRDPVLPLPRPEPARPGVGLRPARPQRLGLRGEPAQRLRPQPGRLRGRHERLAADELDFPVPGLAVGRLVETPAEIAGLLDAYTQAGGVVSPSSSLVTGYDFLADAADAVATELQAGTGADVGHADHPGRQVAAGSRFVDRLPAVGEAARQPPRRDLPRRPLQRQQRARRRLLDERAHDRARRLVGRTSPTRSSSAPAATRATTSSTATRSRT